MLITIPLSLRTHQGISRSKGNGKKAKKAFKKQFPSSKQAKGAFITYEESGWKYRHYWNPATIAIDWAIQYSPYTRMAVGAAYSAFGPWGSAGFALYSSRLDGASYKGAIIAAVVAGGTSYAFQGADSYFGDSAAGIVAHGAIGGTSAEMQGGSFVRGFAISAGAKTLSVSAL